jgi:hypothetical protein
LVFAALLFGAPAPSAAASYTLSFTGTVETTEGRNGNGDVFAALGIVSGDPLSGSISIDPFNESPTEVLVGTTRFDQPSVAYTFHVSHPGKVDLTFSDSGSGRIFSGGTPIPFKEFGFFLGGSSSSLVLFSETDAMGEPLLSLAGLPTTLSGILAMLGGVGGTSGTFELTGLERVEFNLKQDVNTVPIPTAFPLFVSALCGFGVIGWRRRST